jgi:phosphomannomutase
LHYGRDALVGIALFLSYLAKKNMKCSELRSTYPEYYITKNKIQLTADINVSKILQEIETVYSSETDVSVSTVDGVKLDFADGWVHLRKSNTEPIIRIYAESKNEAKADKFAQMIIEKVQSFI